MAPNKKVNGFTLVELLLAATLGAMVVVAAFSSIGVVLKGYRLSKDRSDVYEPARAALARMCREISSAFLSPHGGKTWFTGVQQEIDGVAMDQLTFVADEHYWGGVPHLLGPHVVAMSLIYFDGSSWLPEWDSTDQLPMAVSMTIGVTKNGQVERPEDITRFSTIVYPVLYRPATVETTSVQ